MTEQIGRVLGGRYRLLAPLGAGASAQVYLADDVRLRRRVAVKVLHAALADDEAFLRRFRAEAQAAAALNHPHILAVYDWSGDADTPFLVTEYLSGGSLRSMLDTGHRLSLSQALVVGLEAVRALDHAHRQGFVHRDIKPANLLLGDDARLRIADFGLARAIAEAAWTEPQGAVLGTARYASPEQARGEPVDGRSDVYSLALVLVESVTGVVPFAADTTIGTLMARIDRPLDVPDELGVLQPLLTQAGALDPAQRLDAAALGRSLVAAAGDLPRPAPLPLTGGSGAAAPSDPGERRDPTLLPGSQATVAGDAAGGAGAPTVIEPRAPGGRAPNGSASDRTGVLPLPPPGAGGPPGRGPGSGDALPMPPLAAGARPNRRWLVTALAVAAALVAGALGAVLFQRSSVPSHTVPQALIGAQRGDIARFVGDYSWRIDEQEVRQDDSEPGEIVDTEPEPGTELREGGTLVVKVSVGRPLVDVPQDLAGLTREDAEARLAEPGTELTVEVADEPSDDVDAGVVIRLGDDVPAQLPKGSAVTLVVSSGLEEPTIPDVRGMTFDEAREALEALDLEVDQQPVPGRRGDERVLGTDPDIGDTVERGSRVTVFVAGGEGVEVPDVVGDDLDEAREELEDEGLEVGSVLGAGDGEVFSTFPGPGTEVPAGTEVQLIMQ